MIRRSRRCRSTPTSIPSRHPADRFLSLLARLEAYRYALLLWTNVSNAEVMLIETLDRIPPNVAIVLTSAYRIQARWPGPVAIDGDAAGREEPPPACFIDQVMREDYSGALARAVDGAALKTDEDFSLRCISRRLSGGGWTWRRRRSRVRARSIRWRPICSKGTSIAARGGTARRANDTSPCSSAHTPIMRSAKKRAHSGELAYVANEMGDRGLADQMFRNAIATLGGIEPKQGDSRWSSALARALRDHADILAYQGSLEALPLLRRATAIHAFERRSTQVAYCFLSRSKLMLRLGRFRSAGSDAEQAAIVFSQAGNADGWVAAITLAAQASSARNRYDQARAVLDRAASHRSVQGNRRSSGNSGSRPPRSHSWPEIWAARMSSPKMRSIGCPLRCSARRAPRRKLQQFVETLL